MSGHMSEWHNSWEGGTRYPGVPLDVRQCVGQAHTTENDLACMSVESRCRNLDLEKPIPMKRPRRKSRLPAALASAH